MPKLFLKSIFDMRFVVMIPITMCLRIGFSTLIPKSIYSFKVEIDY